MVKLANQIDLGVIKALIGINETKCIKYHEIGNKVLTNCTFFQLGYVLGS